MAQLSEGKVVEHTFKVFAVLADKAGHVEERIDSVAQSEVVSLG